MLFKTRGIVFHRIKYSESSVIVKIYTENYGLQSYLIKGIRRKDSKLKPALLQHLTLLEFIATGKNNSNLKYIKEITAIYPFKTIPFDIKKSSVIIFLNEILYNSIREEEANEDLFEFIYNAIMYLDLGEKINVGFSLWFLIHLTKFLGFFPRHRENDGFATFNMEEGIISDKILPQPTDVSMPFSRYIIELMNCNLGELHTISISKKDRLILLDILLRYYKNHLPGLGEIKSHYVLQSVLND
ncbi:MAG: DNA repair protein RecO [Bacteroidales bacterium]